jgi:hypothetical protein
MIRILIAGLFMAMGLAKAEESLPYGLKPAELKQVRIFLSNSVKKTGFGKEQLEISGTGEVTISHSKNLEAPLESLSGKVPQDRVVALLSYMESNGFTDMQDGYSANSMYESVRFVRLTLPGKEKGVYAEDPLAPHEFIRIYGAVKFLAGTALPICLDRKKYFFFYL